MAVHVIIKRKIKTNHPDEILPLLQELRARAEKQKGYISAETLQNIDSPDEILVVSKWETAEDWKFWFDSRERRELQGSVDSLIGERTFYEVFQPLA